MDRRRRRRRRKRDNSDFDNNDFPPSLAKRLRRPSPAAPAEAPPDGDSNSTAAPAKKDPSSTPVVHVRGLPADCTVLELKSRLEAYGPISRIRIDVDASGYVTFRSDDSADAATSASLDAFGITIRNHRITVCRATDPLLLWRKGVGASAPSKLLRAEIPLSRHGRSNKKLTAGTTNMKSESEVQTYGGREIIAYDDLL